MGNLQDLESPPPLRQGWQGKAELTYDQRGSKCVPVGTFTQAPLRVQRPLYPEGPEVCHSVLVHTAGGMVGGDRLDIHLKLTPRSQVLFTTAAANKIYGLGAGSLPSPASPAAGCLATAHQGVQLTLAPESCLEWFPQDTIVFSGAQYRQTVRVDLAPNARWCGWEITRFGRSARGERFDQGSWRSCLEIWQQDRPLWMDRQYLVGGSPALDSPNGLAGYPVIGSFALVGMMPTPAQVSAVRQLWPVDQPGDTGVTRLQAGLLCRYRGPSSEAARRWFVAAWQSLRPWYLGREAIASRVWPH